ncbi:MAG: hypothetical protein KDH20_16155 [Rhodocyclaceae bacterium]|nr:hypothetical protein [Rhodocyclaceae bacterium]
MTLPDCLELAGSPADMGRAFGTACRSAIREYTRERVDLCTEAAWAGHTMSRAAILDLADACLAEHASYAPDLVAEMTATAEACGLSPAELLITNGFTDFIDLLYRQGGTAATRSEDDCTAFFVPAGASADGHALLGQTWDMHAGALPYVLMLRGRPTGQPAFLVFSVAGCVGMIGMNDAGLSITINNLLGSGGQVGVTWPFVVRKALQQTDIESALACITSARLAGAHNYLLLDRDGQGINVEAMPGFCHVARSHAEVLVHSNHCLTADTVARCRPRLPDSQRSSESRLARAERLLEGGGTTVDALMALTADPDIAVRRSPPLEMETCGAAIMQPATGRMWAVTGMPGERDYVAYRV